MANEEASVFEAGGERLLGILHAPPRPAARGVLLVVGGPQYRVGSHRQFLLLARYLAAHGVPVFRFDYRGMGDSGGPRCSFEEVEEDIRAAADAFQAAAPEVRRVVIWGLCDAASAALLYAWRDPRVDGLILLNPWVRTDEGLAKAHLKHYYLRRLTSRGFWRDLATGRFRPVHSVVGLSRTVMRAVGAGRERRPVEGAPAPEPPASGRPLPARMAEGWRQFDGSILVILSGNDLTAAEFQDTADRSPYWRRLLNQRRVSRRELPEANHTFSRQAWRDQVARWTLEWIVETQ